MKLEVEYVIEKVTRYRITSQYHMEGVKDEHCYAVSWHKYGEFESKKDAERVVDALERSAAELARSVL